jgi:ABC-type transport system involved in multi-copper enzyme maturation permease subunit
MREKVSAILFLVILMFIAVFCWHAFNKLFIETSDQLSNSAVAAFFGAFFAFLFIRIGDFINSYLDRINKGHNSLIKLERLLNFSLSELDNNLFVIESFEETYDKYKKKENTNIIFWQNRLTSVSVLDELLSDLLNIDLINELFTLNIHLHKLSETAEDINAAYKELKDALINKSIDPNNYMENLAKTREHLLLIKKFFTSSISETTQALAAVRVLAKNLPLKGYLLKMRPSYHYGKQFKAKRENEQKTILREIGEGKKEDKAKIDAILKA